MTHTLILSHNNSIWTCELQLNLFDVAMKLLVTNWQGGEELLKADGGPLLPGMRSSLDKTALVVKDESSAHMATFMAGHYTEVTGDSNYRLNFIARAAYCSLLFVLTWEKHILDNVFRYTEIVNFYSSAQWAILKENYIRAFLKILQAFPFPLANLVHSTNLLLPCKGGKGRAEHLFESVSEVHQK